MYICFLIKERSQSLQIKTCERVKHELNWYKNIYKTKEYQLCKNPASFKSDSVANFSSATFLIQIHLTSV